MGNSTSGTADKAVHTTIPVNQLDALVGEGGLEKQYKYQPYDVFLVATGERKRIEVDTMANFFQGKGIRCFFDSAMLNVDGPPVWQMRSALLSCRYTVAVVSPSFLLRKDPMQELEYAFRRLQWMRSKQIWWPSLLIVLVDLSVDEFRQHSQLTQDIVRDIRIRTFDPYEMRWSQLCGTLVDSMLESDNKGAVMQWTEFLKQLGSYSDLPLPTTLYEN